MPALASPFPQITTPPQALAEVVLNENLAALASVVYGYAYQTSSALTWGYLGGRWGGHLIAAGTLTLTDAAANYLVVEIATGAMTASTTTTNWNSGSYVRVFKVTTAAGAVTAVEDHRSGPNGVHGGAAAAATLLDTDGTMAANSDTVAASQKATRTYVAAQILATLASADVMEYKGATDCSANPNYPAADAGAVYIVSVAGKIGGASGITVEAGDLFVCKTDSTASGNQATVGANWDVVQTNIVGAALTSAGLAQFAASATTSAELRTLLSDETGTGAAVFANAPALVNPTVGTQSPGDNSTKASSTAYADAAAAAAAAAVVSGVSSVAGRSGAVTLTHSDLTDFTEAVQDVVGAFVAAANGVRAVYDDAGNTLSFDAEQSVNLQTSSTYTLVSSDRGKLVNLAFATAIGLTIPQAGSTGFPLGWWCDIEQGGAGAITGTPTTSTVDGAATVATTTAKQGFRLVSDGTNWYTIRGIGSAGGGGGGAFTYASSAPGSPTVGDRWVDSTSGVLYTYVDDGTTSQWVEF